MGIPIYQEPGSYPSKNVTTITSQKPGGCPTPTPKGELLPMHILLGRSTVGTGYRPINDQRILPSQIQSALKATFGS